MNCLLALGSSVLLVLLFPRFSFVWLAPVALTPLLIACARETRWRSRFVLGYVSGVAYWFGLCNWIQWTLAHHAGVGDLVAWLLFVLFCLAKAVHMGVFAVLAGFLLKTRWSGAWLAAPCVAALWVALEWSQAYTGFEWLNLGNAGGDMSLLLRLAPIAGVWGLSFVFALMSAVVAILVLRRHRFASAWLLLLLCLYLLPDIPAPQRGEKTAVIVQPNIDDETVWSPELQLRTEKELSLLSFSPLAGRDKSVDMIVWPEMPAPFYANDPRFLSLVSELAKTAHAGVLTGVVGRTADRTPLNSALLTGPEGAVISRYDKVKLVPFGEFVPWPFGALTQKISTEAGDFEAGSQVVVSAVAGHRIGTFICYESVFPNYVRKFAAAGAEALFNISNDSWFGKSQARYQHLRIVRMRAAENRRWIVRATNDGVSAVIDPAGRVVRTVPEFQEVAARMTYGYRQDLTFYTRFGDWFVALCGGIAAAAVLASARPTEGLRSRPGSLR
ncbi:MAG: apolipoprotein N-acyltransferase [Acidobacteriota bacterium]